MHFRVVRQPCTYHRMEHVSRFLLLGEERPPPTARVVSVCVLPSDVQRSFHLDFVAVPAESASSNAYLRSPSSPKLRPFLPLQVFPSTQHPLPSSPSPPT